MQTDELRSLLMCNGVMPTQTTQAPSSVEDGHRTCDNSIVHSGEPDSMSKRSDLIRMLIDATPILRKHVGIDEATFQQHSFHNSPREFFLWTALDEVVKCALFCTRIDAFIDGADFPRPSEPLTRIRDRAIEAVLLEELHLRLRRLCELLVQLTLFAQAGRPEVYHAFLLMEDVVRLASQRSDTKRFYEVESAWLEDTIERSMAELRTANTQVHEDEAWYKRPGQLPPDAKDLHRLQTSARDRLSRALPQMTSLERLTLGLTYREAFGVPSETIHYRSGVDPLDHSKTASIYLEMNRLLTLSLCAINRVAASLGFPEDPLILSITQSVSNNPNPALALDSLVSPAIHVGDFVVARGYFGRVVDRRTSAFGYLSVRVELLAEKPIPDLAADWFPANDVKLLWARVKLVEGLRSAVKNPDAFVDDDDLRLSALEAWTLMRHNSRLDRTS